MELLLVQCKAARSGLTRVDWWVEVMENFVVDMLVGKTVEKTVEKTVV